ncbi:MAG: SDR family NAD(P)-dependent oxidoreductase [Planctomycetales bacterium]|nr:SDR family NAD(P)-dependent oxidoreductase [Planctomycetales bacterium]
MEFKNTTAVITGASGGLGREIAVLLGQKGLHCLCHYGTHAARAEEAVAAIRRLGQKAEAVQGDLSGPACADLLIEQARKLGPVRVIVNSASIFQRQPLGTFSQADVSKVLAINLTAPLLLCNAFSTYLKKEGLEWKSAGHPFAGIINLVDVAGIKPWGEYSPYCASRGALIAATKSLAKELAPGITVNAIAPGIVAWPGKMDPSEEKKQLSMIPAGRFGMPKDITRVIDFLLDSGYITGQVLCVDGGRSI